jgi:tetratricopeptide (TPR) repeat protein
MRPSPNYHEALALDRDARSRYGLSWRFLRKIGDLEGAIRLLREVIKAAPNFGEAHYNLGLNLWNKYKSSMGLRAGEGGP